MRIGEWVAMTNCEPLFSKSCTAARNGDLPGGRKRGFRFVEQINPVASKAIQHQGEEGFAVRLLV